MGYPQDSPTASPYGYTVKLALESRRKGPVVDEKLIRNKRKAIAWFVSNCNTESMREKYVEMLKVS